MATQSFLKNIEKVKSSAAMNENVKNEKSFNKKKKLINLPVEWEDKIKAYYGGTINSYIMIAIQERMQKDGLI
jgi:hypothetical protein